MTHRINDTKSTNAFQAFETSADNRATDVRLESELHLPSFDQQIETYEKIVEKKDISRYHGKTKYYV